MWLLAFNQVRNILNSSAEAFRTLDDLKLVVVDLNLPLSSMFFSDGPDIRCQP